MTIIGKDIRKEMLKISHASGHGHLPSCFSVVEILEATYQAMRHRPQEPYWDKRDIFVLSKGHAALAHYCVLAHAGYFDISAVSSFGSFMSDFGCHACRCKVPGVEASTGSLGHGIGISVGIALAFKIQKSDRKVFVLIGDGEANEGAVWESIMVAINTGLDNLVIIYDNNLSQSRGLHISNPAERFTSFGCRAVDVNGHDVNMLKAELGRRNNTVKVIIANTEKGHGCKTFVENPHQWHRKSPNDAELEQLLGELNA